jgi:tetratricopeptide (TPR) repeat protein
LAGACHRLIDLADRLGENPAKADGLHLLGNAHTELGEFEAARAAYGQAAELWAANGAHDAAIESRQGLVNVLQLLGEPEQAFALATETAQSGNWFRRCVSLISLACILEQLTDFGQARAELDKAESVLSASPATPQQTAYVRAYLLGNHANIALARGELRACLDASHRMSAAADLAGLRSQKLEALINIGVAKTRLGDLADAWRHLDQAHQAASLAGDQLRESTANAALAEWFTTAGLCDRAIAHGSRAVELASASKARFAAMYAQVTVGSACLEAQDLDRAAEPIASAVKSARALRFRSVELAASVLDARLMHARGDSARALELLRTVVAAADGIGAAGTGVEGRARLAAIELVTGNADVALPIAEQAVRDSARLDARPVMWLSHYTLGRILAAQGKLEEAQTQLQRAVAVIEEMWWPLWAVGFAQVQEIKASITSVYFDLLRTAISLDRGEVAERVLALSPWPFLREQWEAQRARGRNGGPLDDERGGSM